MMISWTNKSTLIKFSLFTEVNKRFIILQVQAKGSFMLKLYVSLCVRKYAFYQNNIPYPESTQYNFSES